MNVPLFHVDAFTARPFGGNPAAVCILNEARDEVWMQNIAAEMNLSETAFLQRQDDGYRLRWFTPKVEVDLCGHATLASAHVLWEERLAGDLIRFHTRSGILEARRQGQEIGLDFPATPAGPSSEPPGLSDALHVAYRHVGKTKFDHLIEVESESVLRELSPDFSLLSKVPMRGLIVTCPSDRPEFDFVSRFFVPGSGVNEDPVTGSAHCCLGPHWKEKTGKNEMVAYQASARGGIVRVRVADDRVILGGQAVIVARGELV